MSSLASFAQEMISRLAWTSLQAMLLIGAVWLIARQLPRLPAATRSLLWWLLGVQLLLGLALPTPVSLPLLSPAPAAVPTVNAAASFVAPSEHRITAFSSSGNAVDISLPDASPMPAIAAATSVPRDEASGLHWQVVVLALWLAGVLVQLTIAARQWRQARIVVRASQPLDDEALQQACADQAQVMGLRRCPSLRVSYAISSPQVSGLLRPIVLLPAQQNLTAEESALALAHELTHLRRGDLWMGWVPAIAQRLFFFHPLVAWAMREYALQREAACDAQVVHEHDAPPQAYGRLLLRLGVAQPLHAGLAGASPTFHNLKRRLSMLQQEAQGSVSRAPGWLLVALVAMAGVLPYRVTQAAADPGSSATPPAPAAAASAPSAVFAPVAATPATPPTPATPLTPPTPLTPATKPTPVTRRVSMQGDLTPPPVPKVPPVPPVPPVPSPLASLGELHAHHIDIDTDNGAKNGFALFADNGDTIIMNGTNRDIDAAGRERKGKESLLWLRRGQQAYVIRDEATIAQARALYAPMTELSRMEGQLSSAEGRIAGAQSGIAARESAEASRMSDMAARQGELESQRAELESQRATLAAEPNAQAARQLDAQMRSLDSQVRSLNERQKALSDNREFEHQRADLERQQADLERQQKALEVRQHALSAQADQQMDELLSEAIAKGVAKDINQR